MRLATAAAAAALGAGGFTVTTLPRPAFPGAAVAPNAPHRLVLRSSRYHPTGNVEYDNIAIDLDHLPTLRSMQLVQTIHQPGVVIGLYGRDFASARIVVVSRVEPVYGFDFASYVWPPRIRPGEREFVYEGVVWAHEASGVLYVENAHATYAASSYGRNGYITAIDLKTKRALWRSPALVANARTFLVTGRYLITGYGFTDEPDYLYLLDRKTGGVVDRLHLPSAPEQITWHGKLIHVRTYDHDVVVKLRGA